MLLGLYIFAIPTKTSNTKIIYKTIIIKTKSSFYNKNPEEGLKEALSFYGVHHMNIVIAQSKLETGNYTSKLYIENNNLFGLYDNINNEYYTFNHWTESVKAYRDLVQNKYKGGSYYHFLKKIKYAADSDYIKKLKEL